MLMKKELICFFVLILILIPGINAATYWISPTGTATWTNCQSEIPLSGTACCSLSTANSNAAAGDTVMMRGGTYTTSYISPSNSGVSEYERITYKNYENENVIIYNTNYGILINNKSYIEVKGINFNSTGHHLYIMYSDHNIVSHCNFDSPRDVNVWGGSKIYRSSKYNHVYNCTFSRWGYVSDDRAFGALFDVGNEFVTDDDSFYNLIENNEFYYGGHHCLAAWSKYSVFRNNYLHHEKWGPYNKGYRNAITHGLATGWNLFEGNRFAFADKSSSMGLRSSNNIFRRNYFYNNGLGGLQLVSMRGVTPSDNNLVYNNVFYNNGHEADYSGFSGAIYFCDWYGEGEPKGNEFKNNIFYNNRGGPMTFNDGVSPNSQVIENNFEGNPNFVFNISSVLTPFGEQPDFRLQQESPCIDAGGALTIITSPTGTGIRFRVENPWYFYDGWTIPGEIGDMIQLEGESTRTRITNINYDTGEITVENEISWTQSQGISLAYEGLAPDIGAHEYLSGEIILDPITPTPDIVTIQDMLGAYQQYKRNEVGILYFLDKLRRWIVFW